MLYSVVVYVLRSCKKYVIWIRNKNQSLDPVEEESVVFSITMGVQNEDLSLLTGSGPCFEILMTAVKAEAERRDITLVNLRSFERPPASAE